MEEHHQLHCSLPNENLRVLGAMYEVEVSLREFIIEVFDEQFGARWWKRQVPTEIREEARLRLTRERETPWLMYVAHHLIYFIDLPHIRTIAERTDNWEACFRPVFSKNKSVLLSMLTQVEPVRNKVAHNRRATVRDVETTEALLGFLRNCLGASHMDTLVARCTTAPDINAALSHLSLEMQETYSDCISMIEVGAPEVWMMYRNQWWFDEEFLGVDVSPVEDYYQLIDAYRDLPRGWGTGHRIEAWVRSSRIDEIYASSQDLLCSLTSKARLQLHA